MVRIYFDKQIFSYLFKAKGEKYIELLKKIYANKDNFLFFYSEAHIHDLKRSDPEFALKELDFMKTIVDNNCIGYDMNNNTPCTFFIDPRELYENTDDIKGLSDAGKLNLKEVTENFNSIYVNVSDLISSLFTGSINVKWFLKRKPSYKESSDTDIQKAIEFSQNFLSLFGKKEMYMTIRDSAMKLIKDKNCIFQDTNVHFNENLKNTDIELSYIQFISAILKQLGIDDSNDYFYYNMAYGMLDILGILREKNKTVEFWNMLTDAQHSYYGSLCDCVVSNDSRFIKKTKILCNLLGIKTLILGVDEFIDAFEQCIKDQKQYNFETAAAVISDYFNNPVLSTNIINKEEISVIEHSQTYFGYFNKLYKIINSNGEFIVLAKEHRIGKSIIPYREIKIVTDRLISIFGNDGNDMGAFSFSEINGLNHITEWKGRIWAFNDYVFQLKFIDFPYGISLVFKAINSMEL